jgi:NTE family protein
VERASVQSKSECCTRSTSGRIASDLIVATSAGAINGAFIASPANLCALKLFTGLLGLLGTQRHLISDDGLRGLIGRHLQWSALEQTGIPLHVVAVELLSGEQVRLSRGLLLDAVLASSAIPGVFPPVSWEERTLIDGGDANNTPVARGRSGRRTHLRAARRRTHALR